MPRATIITPNIPEAEGLADMRITDREGMTAVAERIYARTRTAVFVKGGHSIDDANDLLVDGAGVCRFEGRRIVTANTHGAGSILAYVILRFILPKIRRD